jgi:predicted AlkP superfamily pyrophosphatase or phosphodiesterase
MRLTEIMRTLAAGCALAAIAAAPALAAEPGSGKVRHVLLISVDGMHSVDLARFVAKNPDSVLAQLTGHGVTFSDAQATFPSDSFPGLAALVTGGTPRSTGLYYDDSYDRKLAAADACDKPGTEVDLTGDMDVDGKALDTSVDAKKLPVDPARGCAPVWPHQYLRVNTVFEIVREAGGRTAWSDKHPVYEFVNGPSGKGVQDLYAPEIDSAGEITGSVDKTIAYDDSKVRAILNEIAGMDHAGIAKTGVPTLFGMNFQAVSVAQKLPKLGYVDALATPSDGLAQALAYVDTALGRMVIALKQQHLYDSTLMIVTAKHGQSPIDPSQRQIVDGKLLGITVNSVADKLASQVTTDSVALIWLRDQKRTADVVSALSVNKRPLGIAKIYAGTELATLFADPLTDSRAPDIIVQPAAGVIYTKPTATKIAEHGGGTFDDRAVALLVAHPSIVAGRVSSPVATVQVAPTILRSLGLDPQKLDAVRMEKTQPLPGIVIRNPVNAAQASR